MRESIKGSDHDEFNSKEILLLLLQTIFPNIGLVRIGGTKKKKEKSTP